MANTASSICVVEGTTVAGTRHVPGVAELAAAYQVGERFALVRDAANRFDPWAVEVRDGSDRRIGYVSCECNEFVGRLIDGGKSVEGRLEAHEQIGSWCRLVMGVHLND
ncbi:HIRAN domain-containing protein [Adlercreutzia sp. R21]|uniref:HIRAN domain-containing protein n=1 Tax=Adlercreutzia wanghongyangiae TaxID=3111451 RepID=A0ABU6IKH6_9ACTN|nr:HIRAN domain-containing protein [Adlercreutzia sp. R21]MEC4176905.1 HIRAN domain-containing protein [Adlercreutzia sp. R7]MEC4183279.1 HIRAN domain-containing protein [Adlercreutzia sp. R21]